MGSVPPNIEIWIWFMPSISVVLLRLYSQKCVNGSVPALKIDDWLMVVTTVLYVGVVVTVAIFNIYLPDAYLDDPTPADIQCTVFEDIISFVNEIFMICAMWGIKACLLILYARITVGLVENRIAKLVGVYVLLSFFVILIFFLAGPCRPISAYWDTNQPPTSECVTYFTYYIVHVSLNISSDLMILGIPIAFLQKAGLSSRRRWALRIIFGIGIFAIIAAILTKYYSLTQEYGQNWGCWYVRESSTGILASNLALCSPVFRLVAAKIAHALPETPKLWRSGTTRGLIKPSGETSYRSDGTIYDDMLSSHASRGYETEEGSTAQSHCRRMSL